MPSRFLGATDAAPLAAAVNAAPHAAYLFYQMVIGSGTAAGHLTLVTQPERVTEPTVAWLKYQLLADASSRSWFVGDDCGLCDSAEFEYGQHGLE